MIKKTLTWTDYAGKKQEEDWFFHLSRAELTEEAIGLMGDDPDGDLQKKLQAVIATRDNRYILRTFRELVSKSVGLKSADGSQFIKNEENRFRFQYSGAMDELVLWMLMNPFEAGQFIQGMVPPDVIADAEKAGVIKDGQITNVGLVTNPLPGQEIISVSPVEEDIKDLNDEGLMGPIIITDNMSNDDDNRPAWLKENREPTMVEIRKMSREELMIAYRYRIATSD